MVGAFPSQGSGRHGYEVGRPASCAELTYIPSESEKYLFQKNKCLEERPVPSEASPSVLSGGLRSFFVAAESVEEPLTGWLLFRPAGVRTNR